MRFPLDPAKTFDAGQQKHFDEATAISKGWVYLGGGPGCGKTFVTANVQLEKMSKGRRMLAIFPTHAARLVGIQELIEESQGEATPLPYEGDDTPNENSDVILTYKDGEITYKTIHSALGIKMSNQPGKDSKFIQSFSDMVKARGNFKYDDIFIDEVSMMSEEMITARPSGPKDKRVIKGGVAYHIEMLEEKFPEWRPFVYFTGDFNQLIPVQGTFASHLFVNENFDVFNMLTINHRSGRDGISELISHILKRGRLPEKFGHLTGVRQLKNAETYNKQFSEAVKRHGGSVLGLSYSNRVRLQHSDLAAVAQQQTTQFFVGNTLTVAEGKGKKLWTPDRSDNIIYFYNSEKLTIVNVEEKIVPATEWAGEYAIKAHRATVRRRMTDQIYGSYGAEPVFYLIDFLGAKNKDCPKFNYLDKVKSTLNKKLDPLVNKQNLAETTEKLQRCDFDLHGMIDILYETDEFLGDMVEALCYRFGREQNVRSYLDHYAFSSNIHDLFARVEGGTPNSLFNLLWANMYGEPHFQVLPVRSENAQTCHNAQGSGREIVFLNARDITGAAETVKRLLYVGVSRAKKEITILT